MSSARQSRRLPVAVFAGVIVVFVGLAAACRILYVQTEQRLLRQRTVEAIAVLQVSVSQIQGPLAAAAEVAAATDADPVAMRTVLSPYVGDGKPFTSAALFRIGQDTALTTIGPSMSLPVDGPNGSARMVELAATEPFVIVDLLTGAPRRLGYAVSDDPAHPGFVVYGERTLGTDPNARRRTDQPFSQLDYAIYLGSDERADHLLGSSTSALPIRGRRASEVTPFGNTQLRLVMTPIGHLSGDLFANLWWIVGLLGVASAGAFSFLTRRLLRGRDLAVGLAGDNERLYDEQRQIAETLQLSLLPQHLDTPPGSLVAARYWPAGAANLIGGDFYDVFRVDDRRWGITIGDVCGKGIAAATLTGLARHTVRAAARQTDSPAAVLQALHLAIGDHRPATFCTACFVFVTVHEDGTQTLDLSLGGHPAPLLRRADRSVEEIGRPGTLLGMVEPSLRDDHVVLAAGDVLVLYTDGLTDAPGEEAVPLAEVRALLRIAGDDPIEQVADSIRALKRQRRPRGSGDDTALVIVRFGLLPDQSGRGPNSAQTVLPTGSTSVPHSSAS